jgi:multiple sugar transport system permease protein
MSVAQSSLPKPQRSLRRQPTRWGILFTHICLLLGATIMLYPLLWMLSSSFKPESLIFRDLGLWPSQFTLENYTRGWTALRVPFTRFYVNSFIIVGLTVIGNVISCSVTAYAFARLDFSFKRFWFAIMLATIMLPYHVTLIPQYVLFHKLGWINTFLPLTVPHFLATNAFFIFLMIQFIRGVPLDLDQAAMVDGASAFQIYRLIILPISKPALVTTAIFTFIWNWDNFFSNLLYLNSVSLWTVPLGLRAFVDSMGATSYGPLFAMSILSLVPVFIFFITAQRQLVEGISTTGLKG